jgi:hypothetical protein
MAGCCDHGSEHLVSVELVEFLDRFVAVSRRQLGCKSAVEHGSEWRDVILLNVSGTFTRVYHLL